MTPPVRRRAVGLALGLGLALLAGAPARAMRLPIPHEYGRVVLDAGTARAKVPPVAFDHWRHRALYTCRLCHVDVGFAMTAGGSQVTAASNRAGYHCGACHDGKRVVKGRTVFAACSDATVLPAEGACRRCHRRPDPAQLLADFDAFAKDLPRDRFGGVDWEKAEAGWQVKPADFLEGVSVKRAALQNQKQVVIQSKGAWMSNVLFSHPKHAVWNGCEVCHPEIFPSTGGAPLRYSMLEITSGGYCGACHDKVAFPLADCEKCHVKPVR